MSREMRSGMKQGLVILILLVLNGCSGDPPPPPSLMHQVLGALQIPDKSARDMALASACQECATAGDTESVLLGLPKISVRKLQDETAEQCIRILVASERSEEARRIIDLMPDPTTRSSLSDLLDAK